MHKYSLRNETSQMIYIEYLELFVLVSGERNWKVNKSFQILVTFF